MKKQKVLQDHKRKGKSFIPPFTHTLGPLQEVSWVKTMIPELLWIALIQDYYHLQKGVELITSLSRTVHKCSPSEKRRVFASITSLGQLTFDERACLQSALAASNDLSKVQKALIPLISFYPECPLGFLVPSDYNFSGSQKEHLERLKSVVGGMYDKASKSTMMVQATAIWLAFDSDALKVSKGLALASFPEIEKYPETEVSRKVAGSIRASVQMFFMEPHYQMSSKWPSYFWNRGLAIDRCYFEKIGDE